MYPDPNYQDPNSGNPFEVEVSATCNSSLQKSLSARSSLRTHPRRSTLHQPCCLTQSEPICTRSFCDCFDLKKPAVIVRLPPPCVSMQDYANSDDDDDADNDDE